MKTHQELIVLEEGTVTIMLGRIEHRLLQRLAEEPYTVVTHDQLWLDVWGYKPAAYSFAQSQCVYTVRAKLKAVGVTGLIHAHRGRGYSLRRRQILLPSSRVARRGKIVHDPAIRGTHG